MKQEKPKQQSNSQRGALPQGFWSLLGLILKNTLIMFLKKLPSTVFFIFIALLLHTYLLVAVNNGFDPEKKFIGHFLSLSNQPLSGIVIWMAIPMLLSMLFSRRQKGKQSLGLGDRLSAVSNYFRHAGKDAIAVTLGSLGVALTVGALMSGYASMVMALGVGTFLASKSGSVIALLFRSAWSSIFNTARRESISQYGLATGYVTIFTSSLGFIANSALTPNGVAFGVIFLIIAIVMAKGAKVSPTITPLLILGIIVAGNVFFGFDLLWADDGGLDDPSGGGANGTWISWWNGSGRNPAILMGILPAVGAGFGPIIQKVLNDMSNQIPLDGDATNETTIVDEKQEDKTKQSKLIDPETGKPLIVQDGKYEGGNEGQVWWDGKWVDPDKAASEIWKANNIKQGLVDPSTNEPLIEQDGNYEGGKKGQVWWDGKWVDKSEALRHIAQRKNEIDQVKRENDKRLEEFRARNKELDQQRYDKMRREQEARKQQEQEDKRKKDLFEKIGKKHDDDISINDYEKIIDLKSKKDWDGLKKIYKGYIKEDMDASQKEHDRQVVIADRYEVAETVAKGVVIASKAGLMVAGGPAGAIATGIGVGAISAAGEGAESQAKGEGYGEIIKHTAGGFVSGFKDGAIGHYVNMPGVSTPVKILLPAAADSAETFVRTGGDVKETIKTAVFSSVSGALGHAAGNIKGAVGREVTDAAVTTTLSGAQSVASGGTFVDGAKEGLFSHLAGKAGGAAAGKAIEHPSITGVDPERSVNKVLRENDIESKKRIALDDQPDVIKDLHNTKHSRVDAEGNTKDYVDPVKALDQLADTKASRSAKRADGDIKQPIIDTRKDLIYKPADDATIKSVQNSSDPETQKWLNKNMQKGDKLVMDSFSTPGKRPSLGADLDARMVVERTRIDPDTGMLAVEKIEVPRKHWEDDAYKNFHDNAKKLNTESGHDFDVKLENDTVYQQRYKELQHLKGSGMTDDQIKHRAYAESRNVLYTDKAHMEASRANSDQGWRDTEKVQVRSNILDAKEGKAKLQDAEGYGRMWDEKSRFYHDHPAEALAQSKKGIAEMMGVREGQRSLGQDPAPLKPEYAEAMKIIVKAPTDSSATPEALSSVNNQLQSITDSQGRPVFKDMNDAMSKIGRSSEFNKWTPEAGLNVGNPNRAAGLTGSEASRMALNEQEREILDNIDTPSNGGRE